MHTNIIVDNTAATLHQRVARHTQTPFQGPYHHPDEKPTTNRIRDDLYCVDKVDNSLELEQLKVWISEDVMCK